MAKIESIIQFRIHLKNGEKIQLDLEEAKQIRDYLNEHIPKVQNLNVPLISQPITSSMSKERISAGYRYVDQEISFQGNDLPDITYGYYKDENNDWLVEVKKGDDFIEHLKMGNSQNIETTLGKTILGIKNMIPAETYEINTKWIRNNKIITNPRRIKAAIHILEKEGYLLKHLHKGNGELQSVTYTFHDPPIDKTEVKTT